MKKWLVVGAILVGIPAAFYIALKFYRLEPELPYLGPPKVDTVYKDDGSYEVVEKPYYIDNFCLLTEDSTTLCWQDLRGKVVVVDFFFTRCPGICPVLSKSMKRIQDFYADEEDLILISISVDPEYDKPSILKKYAQRYGYIPGKWIFLTGPRDSIKKISIDGFFLPLSGSKPSDLTHSEKLVLVDRDGHIRGYYIGTDKKDVDKLIQHLRKVL